MRMQQFRLVSMSGMLAVLIWIVADQSLTATATLRILITPISLTGDIQVTPFRPPAETYEVRVTGKKATINSLKAREPLAARIPVPSRAPGDYDLNLLDMLADVNDGDLAEVIVQDVSPSTMTVRIDREKTVTMPIHVLSGALDYDVAPVVEPADVEVTISELAYNELPESERRIVLDPDDFARTASRGQLQNQAVPLTAQVGGYAVQLDPDFVNLRFQLAEQMQEIAISAVPIKIESSLDIFNEYAVEVRDAGAVLTQPITVRGRAEVLERIDTAAGVGFWGTISLTAADKADPGRYRYLTPRFYLPNGVTLVSEVEPIELRLIPRTAPEPTNP